ncbi:MAG: GNAT family N-acetyltransferase [Alphaproteobacteria bacterium]|nr:GNAT family N-acetyltransferase [Alphaproteobacteria bacterium]
MTQKYHNIIKCRPLAPTDDIDIIEKITLACELHNGVQYLAQEELNEKISYLKQRIVEKQAHPEQFKARTKDSSYSALVAEVDGKVVGCAVSHVLSEGEKVVPGAKTELDALYVLPEHQKQGVGFALWQTLIEKLHQQGETVLQLATVTHGPQNAQGQRGPGNVSGMQFYKRQGCMFLDKTRQWKSQTGIPKSKIAIQQYLMKRIDK